SLRAALRLCGPGQRGYRNAMRIIRFEHAGKVHLGKMSDERSAYRIEGDLFGQMQVTDQALAIERLLAPVVPADILCIGLNYKEHATETGATVPANPMVFMKPSTALNNPGDPIYIPRRSEQIDYAAELAVIIGKTGKYNTRDRAMEYVFGYTCAHDASARAGPRNRDLGGGQFTRGKGFDGFCPLGPWIVTRDELPDPGNLRIRTLLNGQVMQDNTTADMIFDVPALIESLSSTMTLRPGSIILTGTPQGVGFARTPPVFMKEGDRV